MDVDAVRHGAGGVTGKVSRWRLAVVIALVATGCSSPPPTVCQGGLCTGPAYAPSTGQRIENGVVAVFTTIGLVPVVPRSAGGPARRTVSR